MLTNPTYQSTTAEVRDVQVVGRMLWLQIKVANASTRGEIDAAFASFEREQPDALIVGGDPVLLSRDQLVSLAASHTLPAVYAQREYVDAGGLMSYGTSLIDGYRLIASTPARFWPALCLLRFGVAANQIRPGRQAQDRQGAQSCGATNPPGSH